jgi:hypothetical protein
MRDQVAYDKEYHAKNAERIRARKRAYYRKNRARIQLRKKAWFQRNAKVIVAKRRAYYHKHKGRYWQLSLAYNYGLSPAETDQLLACHGGKCAICGAAPAAGRRLHIDHDHKTHEIRGCLCSRCNTAVGLFRDDCRILAAAIDYLKKPPAKEMRLIVKPSAARRKIVTSKL